MKTTIQKIKNTLDYFNNRMNEAERPFPSWKIRHVKLSIRKKKWKRSWEKKVYKNEMTPSKG